MGRQPPRPHPRALRPLDRGRGAGLRRGIEAAEILHPGESETVMDAKGPAALNAMAALDLTRVPDARGASAELLVKGLTVLEPSIYGSEGDAAFNPRSKQNFGYAFYAFRQRALQELHALRKLLRIAIVGLPCFVEYADQSWHTGCLSAQTTRRVV